MINSKETTPRPDAPASKDTGLEEVRLRQQAIGVKLRHMFDQVVNEPVPDEFLDILRRADDRSSTKDGK
ncbi:MULTISPECIES: NepR family anti-sigma factor [unclassified Brevundimonas]|uniref:anti-sigma T factor NepR n=1 Tax=unclassified Brevundimonas TaxID=2622653 RepID=UPI0025BC1D1E|nr:MULTISPECIES: NepR family anti-sigma factor [unclassified Brevundimonas]